MGPTLDEQSLLLSWGHAVFTGFFITVNLLISIGLYSIKPHKASRCSHYWGKAADTKLQGCDFIWNYYYYCKITDSPVVICSDAVGLTLDVFSL